VDDDWQEGEVTGLNAPPLVGPALALGQTAEGFDRWSTSEFTGFIREEAEGDGIVSLMVREDPSTDFDVRQYFSREGARDPTEIPRLVLGVEPAPPLPDGETLHSAWDTVDIGFGIKPAFDFDAQGRIHIMGMTEAESGLVWHAFAETLDGPWSPREVARGYFYGPGDLRVDPEGRAHIAWHNHDQADANHLVVDPQGPISFFRIDTPGTHNGWDNSLAIDAQGAVHQATVFPSAFGATMSLEYNQFDGLGWTHQFVPMSGPFMYGISTAIAIDRQGHPHIVFCSTEGFRLPGDLLYARRDENGWDVSTIVTDGIRGRFPTLALDHWDRPHVAWLDADTEEPDRAYVRYGVLNNGAWEIDDVDTLEHVELSLDGARKSTSLELDNEWRPHLAYADQQIVRYAHKPFDTWEIDTVLETDSPKYKGLVVLRLDPNERPGIALWQTHPEEPGLVRLLKARPIGGQFPGDCNSDGEVDLSDPVCLLGHLFFGSEAPLPCEGGETDSGGNLSLLDANADGNVDVSDVTSELGFLFLGGPPHILGVACVQVPGCTPVCE